MATDKDRKEEPILIEDIVTDFHLYDEWVSCKEGWGQVYLEEIDVDMGKQMKQYSIVLRCDKHSTYWKCDFWNSYYNGVRKGAYFLEPFEYTEEEEETEEPDLYPLEVYQLLVACESYFTAKKVAKKQALHTNTLRAAYLELYKKVHPDMVPKKD
jgi:hypothetical protein